MIYLNSVDFTGRIAKTEFSTMFPNISVTVDGNTTPLTNNPQTFEIQFAHVQFGRVIECHFCSWSQTTYKIDAFSDYGGDLGEKFTKLFDVKWYKADMVHIDNQQTIYKQGYISADIDHPITMRIHNNQFDIGYLYGDTLPLDYITEGKVGDETGPVKHWLHYIITLLERKIFNEETKELVDQHLLGVCERNEFEIKG